MIRFLIFFILVIFAAGCTAPSSPPTELAYVHDPAPDDALLSGQIKRGMGLTTPPLTFVVKSIDGAIVPDSQITQETKLRVAPGTHRLSVYFRMAAASGTAELDFVAEAGKHYEISHYKSRSDWSVQLWVQEKGSPTKRSRLVTLALLADRGGYTPIFIPIR